MARRKKSRKGTFGFGRAKKSYKKHSSGSFQGLFLPVAVATFTEPMVDQLINQFAGQFNLGVAGVQMDDVAKVGIGYFLGKKGGLVGNTAKMYGIFGLRNIIAGVAGTALGGSTNTTSSGVQE